MTLGDDLILSHAKQPVPMRFFWFVFALALLASPALGQEVSLHGVQVGDPFPEATETLRADASTFQETSDSYAYLIECQIDDRIITVSAPKDSFETRSAAQVHEISSSLSSADVSSQEVAEHYNRIKEAWSEALGTTDPTVRSGTYYWTWTTDSLEAEITYAEYDGNPHSVDLTLSLP